MFVDPRQKYETPVLAQAFNLWVDIHAPVEMVFRFLTQEKCLTRWWANHCTAEARPGGRLHFVWGEEETTTGDAIFRQFESPGRLVVEWTHRNGEPLPCNGEDLRGMLWPALNIYELAQFNPRTTRLHIHDFGINAGSSFAGVHQATKDGWLLAAARLKKAVETQQRRVEARATRKTRTLTAKKDSSGKPSKPGASRGKKT